MAYCPLVLVTPLIGVDNLFRSPPVRILSNRLIVSLCVCANPLLFLCFFLCRYFAFVPETSKTFKRVTSQRFLKGQKFKEINDMPLTLVVEDGKVELKDINGRTVYPCKCFVC